MQLPTPELPANRSGVCVRVSGFLGVKADIGNHDVELLGADSVIRARSVLMLDYQWRKKKELPSVRSSQVRIGCTGELAAFSELAMFPVFTAAMLTGNSSDTPVHQIK